MIFRSKKLTRSAEGKVCIRCGGHNAYACHYNGIRQHQYGKGRGIKCSDLMTAEFCYKCDQRFSEGTTEHWKDAEERSEEFLHWIVLTNERRINSGVLSVA